MGLRRGCSTAAGTSSGPTLEAFEAEWAAYCEARHAVGLANGLDALTLGLRALEVGPGDEVIVPSNTYIATWLATSTVGATPVPFNIRRVCYIYNFPVGSERGGHAHKVLQQVVFALPGSFRLKVDGGTEKTEFWLRNPRQGVLIDRLIWREMDSFSQDTVCMVLALHPYDETDYIKDYLEFQRKSVSGTR